jgi:hypothetical protein
MRLLLPLSTLLSGAILRASASATWRENSAESAATSIVSGSSGETLACPNYAWKAVDGIDDFGCVAGTGGALAPGLDGKPGGWNAGPAPANSDNWLTFDFGEPVRLEGFRVYRHPPLVESKMRRDRTVHIT